MKSISNLKFIKFFLFCLLACFSHEGKSQRLMEQTVATFAGSMVKMSDFGGRRLLVIILPVDPADSIFQQVKSFCVTHKDSVQVIGVLSEEDGASVANSVNITKMYGDIPALLVLAKGYTRKSAPQQMALFRWLTHKEENYRYDMDVSGVGQKFFIDRAARLTAVLPPQVSLQSLIVARALQSGPPATRGRQISAHP